jgi:hypothetical protein
MTEELRRNSDHGVWCTLAIRFGQFWDFIDNRDIDKHAMTWATFSVTCYMIYWCMEYVWVHPEKSGLDIAAVIAAIMLPWTPLQGAVIKWYFASRDGSTT